jgi:hypothetical protein
MAFAMAATKPAVESATPVGSATRDSDGSVSHTFSAVISRLDELPFATEAGSSANFSSAPLSRPA